MEEVKEQLRPSFSMVVCFYPKNVQNCAKCSIISEEPCARKSRSFDNSYIPFVFVTILLLAIFCLLHRDEKIGIWVKTLIFLPTSTNSEKIKN